MTSSEPVLKALSDAGIKYEHYTHQPIISSADRFPLKLDFNAKVCKNLLVTTRNEARFLLCMLPCEKEADLKALRSAFSTSRLCFASNEVLARLLDQVPGSVGVLSIINDKTRTCEIVLDGSLRCAERIAMHPGVHTETVVISGADLELFVKRQGFSLTFFDF